MEIDGLAGMAESWEFWGELAAWWFFSGFTGDFPISSQVATSLSHSVV